MFEAEITIRLENKMFSVDNYNACSDLDSQKFTTAADQAEINNMSISNMPLEKIQKLDFENYKKTRTLLETPTDHYYGGAHGSYEGELGRFGKVLKNDLSQLNEQDVYLDSGCGDGVAIIEYRELFPQGAAVVGISVTCPSKDKIPELIKKARNDQKFFYYLNDFNDFPTRHLEGKVTIMTDILGAFRFGCNPTRFIEQAGKLLKPGGKLYIKYTIVDGIEKPKEANFIDWNVGRTDSNNLLHLWFYTIRGFDVLEPEMTLEDSRAFQEKCFNEAENLRALRWDKQQNRIVLQRNNEQVQVDTLIANPRFESLAHERQRILDNWYPHYKWEMSDYTKSLIKNKHMTITD
jgi:SAM-dependent methyltransferase